MSRRAERVSDRIRQEIGDIILREIRDPRLRGLVSVTDVETSPDLRSARVFVSVLGSAEDKREALNGLNAATGFIRHELAEKLGLRFVPELTFRLDESIERGARILQILKQITPEEAQEQKKEQP